MPLLRWSSIALSACLALSILIPSAALAQGGTDEEARALFNAGEVAYSEGRYDSALEYFSRAFDLSGRIPLLYNVGSAAEHLRHDAEALAAYERYLAESPPDAPNRVAVAARIEILRRTVAASETAVATTTTTTTTTEEPEHHEETPPPPPAADEGPGVAPWIVVGIGGAVAIVGAVLVGVGFGDGGSVSGAPDGATWASVSGAYDRAPILEGVGFALLGVGVAAAIVGCVWGASTGGTSDTPAVTAWLSPDGAGVVGGGSF